MDASAEFIEWGFKTVMAGVATVGVTAVRSAHKKADEVRAEIHVFREEVAKEYATRPYVDHIVDTQYEALSKQIAVLQNDIKELLKILANKS